MTAMTLFGFSWRWMLTFLGFPIGGALAYAVVRSIDTPLKGLAGGVIAGLVLGLAQWLVLRLRLPVSWWWVVATGGGLAVGLALSIVLFGTALDVQKIVLRALVAGICVGLAQTLVLREHLPLAGWWLAVVAATWLVGWLVTWAARVDLSFNWAVFGATGALMFVLLTALAWAVLLPKQEYPMV